MLDQRYAKYASTTIELQNTPHENSPVQATARGLVITLPHSMDERTFSTAFLAKMQSCSFLYWLETEDGTKHLEAQGVKCDKARRFTSYRHGTADDDKPATELYCIRNTKDGDRLVAVIENVILEHLALT